MTGTLWLIAGPNGVGRTTYARRYLRSVAGTTAFVNLDEIARGLSPLEPTPDAPTAAAAARIGENIAQGRSFALETTLAGRTDLRSLARARAAGMGTRLVFCMLPDVVLCLARIAARVAWGGHAVPEADARRRFLRAPLNFSDYAGRVDQWVLLDTRMAEPRLVASGPPRMVADAGLMAAMPAPLRMA